MIILASGSSARADMLRNAGVHFRVETSRVDEATIKDAMIAEEAPPRDIADKLAELKAMRVSGRYPEQLVLAADQVLVCGGVLFDKPKSKDDARQQLTQLRGKSHELLSAAVIYEGRKPVWRHIGRAQLIMRSFSDTFLDDYLESEGEGLLESVGAYKLEQRGAQLFSRVQGDFFTVLGLPLLEVLGFLRARGEIIE